MKIWKVTFVDGHFGRHVGTALVVADDEDAAKQALAAELEGETSYGKPFRPTTAVPYDQQGAHTIYINYEPADGDR
jgi:hypothetical protein